jgi:hypothetical protein
VAAGTPGRDLWSYNWTPIRLGPATLKSRAIDNSGNVQDPPAEITVIVADTTPPAVTSRSPADGAINVSLDAKMTVTFGEAMDPASVNGATVFLIPPPSGTVPATISYDAASGVATLDPTAPLAPGLTYTAVVKGDNAGVKDLAGNALASDVVWTFRTIPPPQVVSVTPNRTVNVLTDVAPRAAFSKPLDPTSVNTSTVMLNHGSTNQIPVTVSYRPGTFVVELAPQVPLQPAHSYTVTLKGGAEPHITDSTGIPLADDYNWTFTTAPVRPSDPFAPCDPPRANAIACENSKPGSHFGAEFDIFGAGDPSIQGFATEISVNRGQTVGFKIDTNSTDYRLDIYRLGYYASLGARLIARVQPSAPLPQTQPQCLTESSTGLIDCGNWAESASWAVPSNATSGIYIAHLVREDGLAGESHIVFVVRDDGGGSDLLFQTSDTTWQAYNSYGGNSLYVGEAGRAYKVSYNRPFNTRAGGAQHDWLFDAEYPMVRWLESNGYDVSYFTGVDTDRRGAEILEHNVFLSVGHDEYWSGTQRANVEAARDAGRHLAFFSGNTMFWKTRWENSIDGSDTAFRTLVCYKETHADAKIDPEPDVWTGAWRDPRLSPPADGGRPENALIGTIFTVNEPANTDIGVPEALGKFRFWRNTEVANQAPGQTAIVGQMSVGYEWDEDLDNGFRPSGLIRLSTNTVNVPQRLQDYGSTYGPGTATHSLTLYRHSSGAMVFSTAATRWSWGLDDQHDWSGERTITPPDFTMRQATVNLFADMGVQPATLQQGLLPATQSTDTLPPASTITSPIAGGTVILGTTVNITGIASDNGGGLVAGVNVSVDGGGAWNRTIGTSAWGYNWTPTSLGQVTIRSLAVDDSGNQQNPPAEITVTVVEPPQQLIRRAASQSKR